MKLIRTGIAAAAAVALTALAAPSAFAMTAGTAVTVTPEALNGWVVDPDPTTPAPAYAFAAGPHTSGVGSLRFGPIGAANPSQKMIVQRAETIPTASIGLSFDYYIAPDATNKNPQQYYANVYTRTAGSTASFYDCRYDFAGTATGDGWHTVSATGSTAPTTVTSRNGATCGTTFGGLTGGTVFLVALNAGDTSANDAGIKGAFDTVAVTGATGTTTYDFEPLPPTPCRVLPTPGRVGTAGGDVVPGTAVAERISTLGGDDVVDGAGGDDCILGGDGNDVLRGGTGADEISGGAGNDVIDGGAGDDITTGGAGRDVLTAGAGNDTVNVADGEVDTVDCGAGVDTVVADRTDVLRNCENVTRS
ncbi:MAG: hypothetical protein J0I49_13090 [Pseudonocardia sp.]|uniref:calcium-binding protein n=1 Tax=Pseudonocardia sp. TaxID=60912 RepID=UPI001AD46B68|nr:hypothetical protein [Pseudonocardia sp.]MBN9099031.1 hypothetical protein [Pseudonocardia sp.]